MCINFFFPKNPVRLSILWFRSIAGCTAFSNKKYFPCSSFVPSIACQAQCVYTLLNMQRTFEFLDSKILRPPSFDRAVLLVLNLVSSRVICPDGCQCKSETAPAWGYWHDLCPASSPQYCCIGIGKCCNICILLRKVKLKISTPNYKMLTISSELHHPEGEGWPLQCVAEESSVIKISKFFTFWNLEYGAGACSRPLWGKLCSGHAQVCEGQSHHGALCIQGISVLSPFAKKILPMLCSFNLWLFLFLDLQVILGTHQLIESTISDFNQILFTWRCLQPEYQAINGGVTCKVGMLCHCLRFNATFFLQNPGSHETITDIITKGLFIDMRHYIQGLELFEEVKVKSCNTLQTFTN